MKDESMKWEYRQLVLSAGEFPEASSSRPVTEVTGKIHERMSTLGDQGWELAAAVQIDAKRQLLILKRPKKKREPKKGRL